jgi:hypothetical protein
MNPSGQYATLFSPRLGQRPKQLAQRMRELIREKAVSFVQPGTPGFRSNNIREGNLWISCAI